MDESFLPDSPTENLPTSRTLADMRAMLTTPSDLRQAAQLPANYENTGANEMTFDPRLAFELAVGVSNAADVFAKYGVPEADARRFVADPAFLMKIKQYRTEITETGYGFKLKAKIQAETLLTISHSLIHDPETPATVRADLIKWTAKMAGLEPATDKDGRGGGGGRFELNISFNGLPANSVHAIDGTAERIEG